MTTQQGNSSKNFKTIAELDCTTPASSTLSTDSYGATVSRQSAGVFRVVVTDGTLNNEKKFKVSAYGVDDSGTAIFLCGFKHIAAATIDIYFWAVTAGADADLVATDPGEFIVRIDYWTAA